MKRLWVILFLLPLVAQETEKKDSFIQNIILQMLFQMKMAFLSVLHPKCIFLLYVRESMCYGDDISSMIKVLIYCFQGIVNTFQKLFMVYEVLHMSFWDLPSEFIVLFILVPYFSISRQIKTIYIPC